MQDLKDFQDLHFYHVYIVLYHHHFLFLSDMIRENLFGRCIKPTTIGTRVQSEVKKKL